MRENERVEIDDIGYRRIIAAEIVKLQNMIKAQRAIGYTDEAMITNGRISGLYLALSHLEEFLTRAPEE